jgi:hypothetical protein
MNPEHRIFTDEEIDRLLAGPLPETTPEFEARWLDLKRQWRAVPVRPPRWRKWPAWTFLALPAAAVVILAFVLEHRRATPSVAAADFELLLSLDEKLSPATPLLDRDTRSALMHFTPPKSTEAQP